MLLTAEQATALGPPGRDPDPDLVRRYAKHITNILVAVTAPTAHELHCRLPPELAQAVAELLVSEGDYDATLLYRDDDDLTTGRLKLKWPEKPSLVRTRHVPRPPVWVSSQMDRTLPDTWLNRLWVRWRLSFCEIDDYVPVWPWEV
ncbi:hypothetical protein [Deinococcus sp. Leaf326]|uniref:hypothetical protein n=1 Tax=Deinococcus sp. Leaf326 TaxID=1736338 RepID=UPI0006FADB83|nr:hypothetical protein [Deinococcus sp. Leaf326]KQR37771.1 hypothetical protein ASF71_14920 [Deinococcus sp. Leaf326]